MTYQTRAKRPAPAEAVSGPGVYILFWRRKVVYVGRSNSPTERVKTHRNNGRPFDHHVVITCSEDESYWIEKSLIDALQPRQNRAGVREPAVDPLEPEPPPSIVERIVYREAPRVDWTPTPEPIISVAKARDIVARYQLRREFDAAISAGEIEAPYANSAFTGRGARRVVERASVDAWVQEALKRRAGR